MVLEQVVSTVSVPQLVRRGGGYGAATLRQRQPSVSLHSSVAAELQPCFWKVRHGELGRRGRGDWCLEFEKHGQRCDIGLVAM